MLPVSLLQVLLQLLEVVEVSLQLLLQLLEVVVLSLQLLLQVLLSLLVVVVSHHQVKQFLPSCG